MTLPSQAALEQAAVTQEDREAAIKLATIIFGNGHDLTEQLQTGRHFMLDAFAAHRRQAKSQVLDILRDLSSYLGAGMGDENTTAEQFDERIRWGIDHVGRVYRDRAAQVVEECSKRPGTTWGQVKRAILDDTCLPLARRIEAEQVDEAMVERVARAILVEMYGTPITDEQWQAIDPCDRETAKQWGRAALAEARKPIEEG